MYRTDWLLTFKNSAASLCGKYFMSEAQSLKWPPEV
jgi:hypothetical protein